MQLYLVPLEGGAWFKKNHPWKISFLVDWPLSERKDYKVSAGLMYRRWCKAPKTFFVYIYMKHLILIKVRTADPRVTLKFPFVSTCNKRYISKPKNKEIRSVSGKTDSFLLSVFLAEFPSGAWVPSKPANLALAFKFHARGSPRRGTLQYSSGHRWPM